MNEVTKENFRKSRGAAYPAHSLHKAVTDIKQVRERLGKGGFSRETIARALDYAGLSGASATRIATLIHFDLLERVEKDLYKLSTVAERLILPTSVEDQAAALRDSALGPALYRSLRKAYAGQKLPQFLPNILVVNHGINDDASDDVVKNFVSTMEHAGLMHDGQILPDGEAESPHLSNPIGIKPSVIPNAPTSGEMVSIDLEFGLRVMFPENLKKALARGAFATGLDELEARARDARSSIETSISDSPKYASTEK